ncbi:MAG: hypothetical protein PARBB_00957 [Parabacteroides distasonis]
MKTKQRRAYYFIRKDMGSKITAPNQGHLFFPSTKRFNLNLREIKKGCTFTLFIRLQI